MPISSSSSNRGIPMKERDQKRSFSKARVLLSNKNRGVETGETSFRVYYGETGAAVPFMWESQPGTPKHPIFNDSHSNDHFIPPLTPPPSYTTSSSSLASSPRKSRKPRTIFSAFFSSFSRIKSGSHVTPSPVLSSSSYSGPLSWSTSSSGSSPASSPIPVRVGGKKHRSHKRSLSFCSGANKFPLFDDDEEQEDVGGSRASSGIMCFGSNKQGCYSMKNVKNAILSSKGH